MYFNLLVCSVSDFILAIASSVVTFILIEIFLRQSHDECSG